MPNTLLSGRNLFLMGVLFFAYLIAAQVSTYLYGIGPTSPTIIWPAAGIALAGLILGGLSLWPAVALASFAHQVMSGNGPLIALGLASASAIQAVISAWLLRRFGFDPHFSRVPSTIAFVAVASCITTIVPTLGVLVFLAADAPLPGTVLEAWTPWWISQMLSVLIVTAVIVRWLPSPAVKRRKIEWIEAGAALGSLILVNILLFWTPYRELAEFPLIYFILGPLLWIALRVGPRFMTLALFLTAAIALSGTAYFAEAGTFARLGQELLEAELFLVMISFIFLILVTIAEERKDTANRLRENVRSLETALERIRREDEAKGRFIATLAHELRNPLAPLMSSLELMRLEKGHALAESMTEHVNTMRHLLDDLLDISRISREKLSLQKERVELHSIVERSLRTIRPLMEERGHELVLELPEEAVLFEADPVRLEQALVNLLNNAAKYTDPGGTITLAARIVGSSLEVSVIDTGIGLAHEALDEIFEPFFQVEEPGRIGVGLGIGLSLTKNLVEMHEGSIEARSPGPGLGSEFIMRIPIRDLSEPQSRPADTPPNAMLGSMRILVVDDNRAAADALAKLLALRGHVTEAAYSGEEALRRAPPFLPDVIFLDIGLPDMSGYDVAKRLREDEGVSAKLVALTGYGQESDIRKAERAGFDRHLTKPAGLVEIEEILASIAPRD